VPGCSGGHWLSFEDQEWVVACSRECDKWWLVDTGLVDGGGVVELVLVRD